MPGSLRRRPALIKRAERGCRAQGACVRPERRGPTQGTPHQLGAHQARHARPERPPRDPSSHPSSSGRKRAPPLQERGPDAASGPHDAS